MQWVNNITVALSKRMKTQKQYIPFWRIHELKYRKALACWYNVHHCWSCIIFMNYQNAYKYLWRVSNLSSVDTLDNRVRNIFSNRRIRLNCNKFRAYKSIFRRSRKMIFQPVHCFDIIFFLKNIMIISYLANKRFIYM